ncbi:hypothetical protein [Atlantibacter hermannii]|uniref:hypothetical protein n=1 Tax=Atlantibacter hermannii TaxID=565 RepID=UPI002FDDDF6A
MTINERVSPKRLAEIIARAEVCDDSVLTDYRDIESIARELQQYRAAAEPVYQYQAFTFVENSDGEQEKFWFWSDCDERFYTACKGTKRILYAAPQVTSVPEELLSAMEDVLRISDRDHDAWNRAKYAIAAIRSAPAVQAEQLSGNTEQVSQPTLPEPITRNDADGWWMYKGHRVGGGCAEWYNRALDDCRAAIASGNSPVIPDGYALVPKKLTAENGAKAALIGEFNLEYSLTCHECFGEGCEDCSGEGAWTNTIPIDWTTIKDIWAKAIDHFAAAPKQEAE